MNNRLFAPLSAALLLFAGCSSDFALYEETPAPTEETTETYASEGIVTGSQVNYSIAYDTSKWFSYPAAAGEDAEYEFEHMDGDVYALIIPERIELPIETLKEVALENAQSVAPDAQITFEEMRTVNGVELTAMKMTGTLYGIPFEYYGYYYGGAAGTIQFITYTSANLTSTYEADLTELLNGLTIVEE